tara:strand:- start:4670 stop:6037 length:1368 start_codon:yes stop_codon:yes gene_type:complete
MTVLMPPEWQMKFMGLGQSGTKGLENRFRDEYFNTKGKHRYLRSASKYRGNNPQQRRRDRERYKKIGSRQYARNAYNAIKDARKIHAGLYKMNLFRQVGWRESEIRTENDWNRFLRDVENSGGMDAVKAKAAESAWYTMNNDPQFRKQKAIWSKYLKPEGSGKPAPAGGGGQGSGGGMPGGSGGGFGGGMPGGGGTGMPGGMPGGFGGGAQGGRGNWSHGSGLPGGNNSMGDSFSGSRGASGRGRRGSSTGGRRWGGRPSTGLAGGRGQTGGRYGRPMPPRNPRGGGVAGGGRWNWNPGTRQWDDRGGQGGRGRMSQNDFRRRYGKVDGSRPGRGGRWWFRQGMPGTSGWWRSQRGGPYQSGNKGGGPNRGQYGTRNNPGMPGSYRKAWPGFNRGDVPRNHGGRWGTGLAGGRYGGRRPLFGSRQNATWDPRRRIGSRGGRYQTIHNPRKYGPNI